MRCRLPVIPRIDARTLTVSLGFFLPLLLAVPFVGDRFVVMFNAPAVVQQRRVDELWEFVQTLAGRKEPPPLVYFSTEQEPARSAKFLGFYYEHTHVIRISPLAVRRGLYHPSLGHVYLVLGHEMLHYALAGRVPVEEHHCLFVREGYQKRVVEHLVNSGASHPFLLVADEPSGCDAKESSEALDTAW